MDQNTTLPTGVVSQTGTKVIKRYANRKLYDTETSSYVTLNDIAQAVASGREVQVIDNTTKSDITAVTFLTAIISTETETDLTGQAGSLAEILKAGGLSKYVAALKGGV